MKKYTNDYLNQIAFPLGGIGAGSISIAGNGILVDPEINNRPNRMSYCGYSGFAVRAEKDGKMVDCRLLCGDSYINQRDPFGGGNSFYAGFRHFSNVSFSSEFPFAKIELSDSVFPADAVINAFNPFIPSNDKDSSLPAAFFSITLKNTSKDTMTFSVFQNMTNVLEVQGKHQYFEKNGIKGITLNSGDADKTSSKYGSITIATDAESTSHTDYWFRGGWFDQVTMFKNELTAPGKLKNRRYNEPPIKNRRDTATLAAYAELAPGESKTFRFLISWYVPNAECYWKKYDSNYETNYPDVFANYYSSLFNSSEDVTEYCFNNYSRLYNDSEKFAKALYNSSLPEDVSDAVISNLAILKSTTCLRLSDGSFWGWEGVWDKNGSCEGNCQHVYNYAYALAFLFPKLEKGMRTNEIKSCLESDGKMNFRMPINLEPGNSWRACVDGQMGFVIKCFREWKLSGDNEWLKNNWKDIKKCLAFTWGASNPDHWDPEKSGVIDGRQHHTLDVELFGVYAWLTGMYHAALSAAAEMAEFLNETDTAKEYRSILQKGQKILDNETFNGEYFVQLLNIEDKEPIIRLTQNVQYSALNDNGDCDTAYYWNDENAQSKYQIENGCEIDQVLADWHTDLTGLPHVFNQEHRKSALEAIYKYNFCEMHDLLNPCRVFACNDEKGVVMCTWPENTRKPLIPIPYSEECMTGFEYAAAANMLQCGMEKEALEIVHEIRRRYDGKRRNPFSEIECGASYARAMASYSFLLIYSGFKFDLPNNSLGFKPIKNGSYFWSADGAWGNISMQKDKWVFSIDYGSIELEHFITNRDNIQSVLVNDKPISFNINNGIIDAKLHLSSGDILTII